MLNHMFEDYRIEDVQAFKRRVESVCLSDRGVIIIQEKRVLLVSHVKGCDEPLELNRYFKEQLGFTYQICHGVVEFANFSTEKESACFGIIMDYDFWCVIVRINVLQTDKIELQIEQMKMLSMDVESKGSALRFIDKQRRNLIVLAQWISENEVNLIQVIPQQQHIDKFSISRRRKLQFGWENQPLLQQLQHFRSKSLIFAVYLHYVLVYNQLASQNEHSHKIFIYDLEDSKQPEQSKTFPKHILALASYEQPRMISHVEVVPTDQTMSIKQAIILTFYQLPSGLEIVQSDFAQPSTVKRKYLYQELQFSQFIYSSITLKLIQIKGIEYCLENHSILIRSQEGFGESYLVFLNLPSTGSPKIANKVPISQYFNSSLVRQTGFWIVEPLALKYVHRVTKVQIYQMILRCIGAKSKINLECISKELQCLLE